MTPQERIQDDLKTAMKAGDKERVGTLRMLLTSVKNERISAGAEIDEETFVRLVRKAVKQRDEAAKQFRDGGREELAEKEAREAELLGEYLPKAVPEAELRSAIEAVVAEQGLSGPRGIGPVMKAMGERYGSRADRGLISRIAKDVLAD